MSSNNSENSRRSSLLSTDRLDGFTDAVLAIIVTLMAVEIAPPTAAEVSRLGLVDALAEMWPEFFALALSFLLVGQVWVSHHAMWREFSEDLDHQTARAILLRYAAAPVLYGLALALAFVNPRVSIALYVLLIVPYLLPGSGDPNRAAD